MCSGVMAKKTCVKICRLATQLTCTKDRLKSDAVRITVHYVTASEVTTYSGIEICILIIIMSCVGFKMKCRYATLAWPNGRSIQLRERTAHHSVAPSLTFRLRTGEFLMLLAAQSSMFIALESCCGNWRLKKCLSLVKMVVKVGF